MEPQDFLNIIFYGVVLLAVIGHIFTVFLIGKIYNDVLGSLMKAKLCGIRETEGDTVRYEVWKAMQDYESRRKIILWILGFSIAFIILIAIVIFITFSIRTKIADTPLSVLLILVIVVAFSARDIELLRQISNKIKKINREYETAKQNIIDALKKIDKEYPMFGREDSKYPAAVKNLYNLILERHSSRSKDSTIEESKNALITLKENDQYEQVFAYLKLDATFKDQELLQEALCDALKLKLNTKKCETYTKNKIQDSLKKLQTYHPTDAYKEFFKFIRTRLIAVFVLLAFYGFPIFHIFYSLFGAVSVGIATILFAFCIIALTYKQS